jgi:CRISPR-associated endonuclease/helicase Cas3
MTLLAKPDETLMEHTENTLMVFKSIKEAYPNISELCDVPEFWEHLFLAIFLHDFGKGAIGFQKLLKEGEKWDYRHEILSAGFVSALNTVDSDTESAIGLAIITHHKDITELRERFGTHPSPPGKERYQKKLDEIGINLENLNALLSEINRFSEKYLGYHVQHPRKIDSVKALKNVYKDIVLPYLWALEEDEITPLHGKYGIFLKGFLTACDHLASGGRFNILNGIKDMRTIYDFSELRKTQKKALSTKGDAILIAPTGSGKTEAALFWTQANQNEKRSRRVFYLLPYTASINAMYHRLQRDFKDQELVGILHGKVGYFLYTEYSEEGNYILARDKAKEIKNLSKKIYKPYKILTPFQILKAMFGVKGFEQQLSEMANGLFIMDEIHTYDAHTTSLILETLKILKYDYGANILIMSATLPSFIKEIFVEELNIPGENYISLDEEELKKFTRHRVKVLPGGIKENLKKIEAELEKGKRVLVVCNTVSQAQNIFRILSEKVERSGLIHGRFILRDRERIESELKDMNLLVGTQAIEVSLDIDYDRLFTEPAPIDALIQRFGRVNRKGWEKNRVSPVYVFEKGSEKDKYIYNQDIVQLNF